MYFGHDLYSSAALIQMTQTVKKVLPNLKYLQDVHSCLDRLPLCNYFSMSQNTLLRPKGTPISCLIIHYCRERMLQATK